MPKHNLDFDSVRKLARDFAGVEDSTSYGSPALKVRGQLLACIPVDKSAEPGSLAVRIDFEHRAELLEVAPDIYYVTDHYLNYPIVLVRLSRIQGDALQDLLGMAYRFATTKRSAGTRKRRVSRSRAAS